VDPKYKSDEANGSVSWIAATRAPPSSLVQVSWEAMLLPLQASLSAELEVMELEMMEPEMMELERLLLHVRGLYNSLLLYNLILVNCEH
jgi:hypothetical protein